jgi:hypothetical protein
MNKIPFNFIEAHHLYWGIIGAAGSCAWLMKTRVPKWLQTILAIIAWISLICIVDDIGQHWGNGRSVVNDIFQIIWHRICHSWWPFGNL